MNKKLLIMLSLLISMNSWAQGMFVSDRGAIVTIDEKGQVWDGTKIAFGIGFIPAYEVVAVGRNYIVATDDRVYKTDVNGLIYDDILKDEKVRGGDIEIKGDNYFITKRGVVYSFSDYDGSYSSERDNKFKTKHVVLAGKEFFMIEEKKNEYSLYVVLKTGKLKLVKTGPYLTKLIKTAGSNYYINYQDELRVFGVSGEFLDKSFLGKMNNVKTLRGNYFLNDGSLWTINKYSAVANMGPVQSILKSERLMAMPNYLLDKKTNMMITINMESGEAQVVNLNDVLR